MCDEADFHLCFRVSKNDKWCDFTAAAAIKAMGGYIPMLSRVAVVSWDSSCLD